MENLIHAYQDRLDAIEEAVDVDIDRLFENLNIDGILENPEEALLNISIGFKEFLEDEYAEKAFNEGVTFAKKTKKVSDDKDKDKDTDKLPED